MKSQNTATHHSSTRVQNWSGREVAASRDEMRTIATALIVISLAACATNPDKVASAYVSSSEYADYTCAGLDRAYAQNEREAAELYRSMKSKSRTNATAGVVGALLFWPALFFMKGKDAEADATYSELQGRKTAIEKAMDGMNCSRYPSRIIRNIGM